MFNWYKGQELTAAMANKILTMTTFAIGEKLSWKSTPST